MMKVLNGIDRDNVVVVGTKAGWKYNVEPGSFDISDDRLFVTFESKSPKTGHSQFVTIRSDEVSVVVEEASRDRAC
jgi:hypothetical protein